MFVFNLTKPLIKTMSLIGSVLCLSLVGATTASADDAQESDWQIRPGNIPITVTLTNLDPAAEGSDPVYVSIQTEDEFRSLNGGGGIRHMRKPER